MPREVNETGSAKYYPTLDDGHGGHPEVAPGESIDVPKPTPARDDVSRPPAVATADTADDEPAAKAAPNREAKK